MSWDPAYRRLEEGEVIQPHDEVFMDDEKPYWWKPTMCAGKRAPNPNYTSHRVYRRLKEPPT